MSQVSRQLEIGNHKQRTLNTRLSSGTSARTFAVSAGPYMEYCAETGTKNETDTFLVQKMGWRIDLHVLNLTSCEFLFQGVQVNPYLNVDLDEGRQQDLLDSQQYTVGKIKKLTLEQILQDRNSHLQI